MPRSNVDATRALLDQLMGKDRNLTATARAAQRASIHYTSDRICPHFLTAFCPHSLFQHTKSDMGACMRVHDERTRDEFRREDETVRWWYDERFYRYCQTLIDDIERKMKRQQADNASATATSAAATAATGSGSGVSTASATSVLSHLLSTDSEYLALSTDLSTLHTSILAIQAQIDSLTAAGQHAVVERIQAMKAKMEAQRTDKQSVMDTRRTTLEQQARDSPNTTTPLPSVTITSGPQSKRMLLCEVCGTALVAGDDEARMAAHRAGKQHQGYETIREWMKEFDERREKRGGGLSEVEVAEVEKKVAEKSRVAAAAEREEKNGSHDSESERAGGGGSDGWNGRARGERGGGWSGGGRYEERGGGRGGGIGYDRRGGGGAGWSGGGGDRSEQRGGREQYEGRRGGGGYDRAGGGGGRYDGSSGSSRYEDRRSDDKSHRRRSRSRSPSKSRSRSRSRDRYRRR